MWNKKIGQLSFSKSANFSLKLANDFRKECTIPIFFIDKNKAKRFQTKKIKPPSYQSAMSYPQKPLGIDLEVKINPF